MKIKGATTSPSEEGAAFLERLRADVRYHLERRDLYRAKMHSSRATSVVKLRELEREYVVAAERLERAEAKQAPAKDDKS
jgi:hypothetical protein